MKWPLMEARFRRICWLWPGEPTTRLFLGIVAGVLALVAGLSCSGEAPDDGLVQIKRPVPTLALDSIGIIWLA